MIFISDEHKQFYFDMQPKDVYHRALFYLIGLCPDTRRNIDALYDAEGIKPEAIHAGWQTGTSAKVTRLAFNLYTDGVPTAYRYEDNGGCLPYNDDDFMECRLYSASDVFCCEYASYFMEAIKLRYPEYIKEISIPQKAHSESPVR